MDRPRLSCAPSRRTGSGAPLRHPRRRRSDILGRRHQNDHRPRWISQRAVDRSAPDAELARDRGRSQTVLVAQAPDLGRVDAGLTPAIDAPGLGLRVTLTERRLYAGKVRRIDDPLSSEDDIAVNEVELVAHKSRGVLLKSRCLCTFSLNAVARYMQRTGTADEEELLRDMDPVATADGERLVAGAGFKVATDANGGGWRGRAILQDGRSVIAIRTWLPN